MVLVGNSQIGTLISFHQQIHYRADDGRHGQGKRRTGRSGASLRVEVPCGTVVRDATNSELIGEVVQPETELLVARGGRGGRGNARFATSTRQAPKASEQGEPGAGRWLTLELKLLADVGIIGMPNAGKSTLLRRISDARPRVAAYPFTTLRPHLGLVRVDDTRSFVAADVPGLIEGASQGRGLGHRFLRHVERSRILVYVVDLIESTAEACRQFSVVKAELECHDTHLAGRAGVVAGNKIDIPAARKHFTEFRVRVPARMPVVAISAVSGEGVRELVKLLARMLADAE